MMSQIAAEAEAFLFAQTGSTSPVPVAVVARRSCRLGHWYAAE